MEHIIFRYLGGIRILHGWNEISSALGVTARTIQKRKAELEREGIIFYAARTSGRRWVCCWFDLLIRWAVSKASRGESV